MKPQSVTKNIMSNNVNDKQVTDSGYKSYSLNISPKSSSDQENVHKLNTSVETVKSDNIKQWNFSETNQSKAKIRKKKKKCKNSNSFQHSVNTIQHYFSDASEGRKTAGKIKKEKSSNWNHFNKNSSYISDPDVTSSEWIHKKKKKRDKMNKNQNHFYENTSYVKDSDVKSFILIHKKKRKSGKTKIHINGLNTREHSTQGTFSTHTPVIKSEDASLSNMEEGGDVIQNSAEVEYKKKKKAKNHPNLFNDSTSLDWHLDNQCMETKCTSEGNRLAESIEKEKNKKSNHFDQNTRDINNPDLSSFETKCKKRQKSDETKIEINDLNANSENSEQERLAWCNIETESIKDLNIHDHTIKSNLTEEERGYVIETPTGSIFKGDYKKKKKKKNRLNISNDSTVLDSSIDNQTENKKSSEIVSTKIKRKHSNSSQSDSQMNYGKKIKKSLNRSDFEDSISKKQRKEKIEVELKSFLDYDSLVDFLEFGCDRERLGDDDKEMLKALQINIPWEVPATHLVETRMSSLPTRDQRNAFLELGYRMNTNHYSKTEDAILVENWKYFCKLHNLPLNPNPFLSFESTCNSKLEGSVLPKKERINFVKFLGHKLEHRYLYSIYQRFKKLFNNVKKGPFTTTEDTIILQYLKNSKQSNPFSNLALVLNRDRHAILLRYKTLSKLTLTPKSPNLENT